MTRPLLILLMVGVMVGCVSRKEYRTHEGNEQNLRHTLFQQAKVQDEILNRLEALEKKMDEPPHGTIVHADSGLNLPDCLINETCTILVENFHGELQTSTKTLEITVEELTDMVAKKMDERKEPCASSSSIRALKHYPEIPPTQERPNYPCFLCDGMVPK